MPTFRERIRNLPESDREVYESVAAQFEAGWSGRAEGEPDILSFLRGEEPVQTLLLVHLVKCDLEFRRQRGERRQVEGYLERFPQLAADAAALLELLVWDYRLGQTDGASVEDVARRFPALAETFRAAVAECEPPKPWVPPADYDIDQRPLGSGGWGIVYKAHNKRLNRTEAIKVVDPKLSRDGSGRRIKAQSERLRNEMSVAAQLNHANIVHLYTAGESNAHPYFAMEYCPGGTLAERLKGGPLEPNEAAALLETLALAIAAVHEFGSIHRDLKPSRGLIHRDLKPSNILFGEGGLPKIADFGFAQWVTEGLHPHAVRELAGTPAYMAPEQIDPSRGEVREATDVYGLGAILYECLTGSPPFTGPEKVAIFTRALEEAPTAPRQIKPQVHPDLEAVCLKCLAKDPGDRYHTARELTADLSRFRAGIPVLARRQPKFRLAWHWVRTNRWKTIAAALMVTAALTVYKIRSDASDRDVQLANARQARAEQLAEAERRRALAEAEARRQAEERVILEQAKQLAERKRADTERLAAHAARVTAARQLASRGDWIAALPEYDSAIRDGEDDALRLRVERLVGFFALNRTTELTKELDALGRLELGHLATQVKLIRGAWLLCDSARAGEGRQLVREALQDRQHLFSDADKAFAAALAAERLGKTITLLRQALDADPLHYLAASSLPVALAAAGDRDEVRRQARFLRGVFPASPIADVADALVAFLEGDRAELKRKVVRIAEKLPQDRQALVTRMEAFLLLLMDVQAINIRGWAGEGGGHGDEKDRALQLLDKAKQIAGLPNAEPLGLPVPTTGLIQQRCLDVLFAYRDLAPLAKGAAVPPGVLARLKALNEDSPDAALLLLTAMIRARMAGEAMNREDVAKTRTHLQTAAELAARAVRAPCLLPRSPVPYMARGLGMVADITLLKLARAPDPIHLRRVRASMHLLVSEGQNWKSLRQGLIRGCVATIAQSLTRQLYLDWNLEDPAGKDAFNNRRQDLVVLCQALLDDWAIDEPNNPDIPRFRNALRIWVASPGILDDPKAPPPKK
ncbi:MAG: protein kinase [Gemmataceae bacterium]|nr:protein kinase [Gemmataceae bacterium]